MKIPLSIVVSLIFFILVTGCMTQSSSSGKPVTTVTTIQPAGSVIPTTEPTSTITPMPTPTPTPTTTSLFPDGSKLTTLITVTGQSGRTSDTFSVPGGYWELWYTADPLTSGGQDSVSGSGSNSAVFPSLSIQVIDKNSGRVVETVEPPGGLDKTMWVRSGIDPRPWKQKFYEGDKEYYLVITTKHIKSYTIEARVPKSA